FLSVTNSVRLLRLVSLELLEPSAPLGTQLCARFQLTSTSFSSTQMQGAADKRNCQCAEGRSTLHSSSRQRGTWWRSMDALRPKQRKRLPSAPRPQAIARVPCLLAPRSALYASTAATARPALRSPRSSAARHYHWRRSVAILGGPGCSG